MTMFKSGKAANLARLRENGFSVPPFFVVPANDVAAAAAHGPEGFERLAERLRQERQGILPVASVGRGPFLRV